MGGGDNSLVPLAEGETESFLHALFLGAPPFAHRQNRAVSPCPTGVLSGVRWGVGAPWYTFLVWWPAVIGGVYMVADGKLHPATLAAAMTLAVRPQPRRAETGRWSDSARSQVGYYTPPRYSPVL